MMSMSVSNSMEESESLAGSSLDSKSSDDYLSSSTSLDENYYSLTIGDLSLNMTVQELEEAVERVKANVLNTEASSAERHKLVKTLIELRLKLQALREVTEELEPLSGEDVRIVQNHQFVYQQQYIHMTPQYCNRCDGVLWTVLQRYFKCRGCHYQCHHHCLNQITRLCQFQRASAETRFILAICPEKGLPSQNYKCAECKVNFTLKNSWMEPRRCDYDGLYYCPTCHKNSVNVIPARILSNWDFEERKVCEASKQFLGLILRKPIMNLEEVNPMLFGFIEDLNAVKRFRQHIIMMKEYFVTCKSASKLKLLRLLEERQHFVENSYMYSLIDLVDVHNGSLIKFLESIYLQYSKHIREECVICHGKGFICEICENDQPIFPFDPATHHCKQCKAVFHNICISKRESCPKCLRWASKNT